MKLPKARKLPSGSWFIRVQVDGKTISITKPTEREALAEAAAVKARLKDASRASPRDKTLRQAIDAYIEARRNVLSPATIRGYSTIRDNRFKSVMDQRIGSIRPERWVSLVNTEARLVSAKTLKNSWGLVSSVIHETTGETVSVRLPQVIPAEREFLEPEQIPIFLDAVRGDRVEIIALLALSSLRRSEILALRWEDVDLKRGVVHVNGATVPNEANVFTRKEETKNETSRRTVPIIAPLRAAMEAVPLKEGPIVTMHISTAWARVNAVCEKNGLPKVGLHGLRHSFASLAYHLRMPEKVAMEIGGWSDESTMKRIYTHIAQRDKDYYTNAFSQFFTAPEPNPHAENCNKNCNGK